MGVKCLVSIIVQYRLHWFQLSPAYVSEPVQYCDYYCGYFLSPWLFTGRPLSSAQQNLCVHVCFCGTSGSVNRYDSCFGPWGWPVPRVGTSVLSLFFDNGLGDCAVCVKSQVSLTVLTNPSIKLLQSWSAFKKSHTQATSLLQHSCQP